MVTIFGELEVGDLFFDPFCGEDFKKTGETTVVYHSTGGDYSLDGFSADFQYYDAVLIDPENTKAPDGASV